MTKINKLLVANRGEIALRIMRSAKEMGIQTVAVYSEADRLSPHVRYADQAVCLGAAPSSQSYLNGDKIIRFCQELQVDAIHPGYGFLSENAGFARDVAEAGLIFVGPTPHSMEVMGSKLAAKQAVASYSIPLVPGTSEPISDIAQAKSQAATIGYPILIKASAGGGGKGMRIVEKAEDFETQMHRAVSEANASFGDGAVFLEKYIPSPRHIEIQVLGDQQGTILHLFERECSIQRRHQKVIEEAPSAIVTESMRQKMGEAAVAVAKACKYIGAGTVEFIVDENLDFYFLEMNTRLQVEHPVTEQITGIDLVKEQIRIAAGKPLSFAQKDLKITGHAIEVRVYAEDPANDFLPDIGTLIRYQRPQGPGIRVDDGFEEGMEIPIYYDPMISKLIAYGSDREDAIARMVRAIDEYQITGIQTTLAFCRFAVQHPAFRSGKFDTRFVEKYFSPEKLTTEFSPAEKELLAALALAFVHHESQPISENTGTNSPLKAESLWRKRLHADG